MHVVIGGYGRVGRSLAHRLEAAGHTVAVVDRSPDAFFEFDDITGMKLVGEVFDRVTLEKAGIQQADCFAAVTSGDNSNIVSARVARGHYGIRNVVARIFDPRRAELYKAMGIRTLSAVEWATDRLYDMIIDPHHEVIFTFGAHGVEQLRLPVPETLVGTTVSDLERHGELRVAALVREGTCRVGSPDIVFAAGDVAIIAATPDGVAELDVRLGAVEGGAS